MGLLKSRSAAPGPPSMAQARRNTPPVSTFSSQSSHHIDALQGPQVDLESTCMLFAFGATLRSVIALAIMPP